MIESPALEAVRLGARLLSRMSVAVEAADVRLEHDDQLHRYFRGARPILGVNEALESAGLIDRQWFRSEDAARGREIHALAAEAVSWPGDDPESDDWSIYRGYGRSLLGFLEAEQPETLAVEVLVTYAAQPCAGTLDWLVAFRGHLWILDWKAGAELPWHPLQTAAYLGACRSVLGEEARDIWRGCLYLQADGTPAILRAHYKPSDHGYFQAALACASFARGLV